MAACVLFPQQPALHAWPQHEDAVLSLPQSLQQDAAVLSPFMQDLLSLPQQAVVPVPSQQPSFPALAFLP